MPQDLVLIRHGQSEGNVAFEAAKHGDLSLMDDRYRARPAADYRLTGEGRTHAHRAGDWVQEWMARRAARS